MMAMNVSAASAASLSAGDCVDANDAALIVRKQLQAIGLELVALEVVVVHFL
jgi:predicted transglutaminase-like cysteine proteinase